MARPVRRWQRWLWTTRAGAVCHVLLFVVLFSICYPVGHAVLAYVGIDDAELSLTRLVYSAVWGAVAGLVGAAIARMFARPRWLSADDGTLRE